VPAVDYAAAEGGMRDRVVDMSSHCGNMTSAVAPFAVEEGIFPVGDGPAMVRMFNTNTKKVVHAHFTVQDGRAVSTGDMEVPGVSGTGAPMRLDWMDPAGTAGRGVLPTGKLQETFSAPGFGEFPGSIVDAASVCVYVPASAFGLTCAESPMAIDDMKEVMAGMEYVRRDAAVRAGLAATPEAAAQASPRVALIAPPVAHKPLAGTEIAAEDYNIAVRVASLETIHRAVHVTRRHEHFRRSGRRGHVVERNGRQSGHQGRPQDRQPVRGAGDPCGRPEERGRIVELGLDLSLPHLPAHHGRARLSPVAGDHPQRRLIIHGHQR